MEKVHVLPPDGKLILPAPPERLRGNRPWHPDIEDVAIIGGRLFVFVRDAGPISIDRR
jgi:hypothetical protein